MSKFLCQLRHTLLPGNREDPAFDSGIPTCPQQDYQLSGRFSQAVSAVQLREQGSRALGGEPRGMASPRPAGVRTPGYRDPKAIGMEAAQGS